jgi:hypothetical protein
MSLVTISLGTFLVFLTLALFMLPICIRLARKQEERQLAETMAREIARSLAH